MALDQATQTESFAATLRTIADTVRRIMRADTSSVASFSLAENKVTWKARSGFRARGDEELDLVMPLGGKFLELVAITDAPMIVKGIGERPDISAADFPLHGPEGVRDLTVVPLKARGETLGALVVGYRSEHRFTSQQETLLEGLADMAAMALDHARLFETVESA